MSTALATALERLEALRVEIESQIIADLERQFDSGETSSD
jgi:hypothetical protein